MLEALSKLEAAQYVSSEEMSIALEAEEAGTARHTVGYELEIKKEAVGSVPMLGQSTPERVEFQQYGEILGCQNLLTRLGFGAENEDGLLYEIVSPPSQHALPLDIATRGLVKAGVLPANAKNNVTAHVSIGTRNKTIASPETRVSMINMLRAIELAGGSTAYRLVLDPENSFLGDYGWDVRGQAGVDVIGEPHQDKDCRWQGKGAGRVELRSLDYLSPDQFGQTLNAVYFLSRGLLEQNPEATQVYRQFENWFLDYQEANDLRTMDAQLLSGIDLKSRLGRYIVPFAEHIATADLTGVRTKVATTISALKEVFGMTSVGYSLVTSSEEHKEAIC